MTACELVYGQVVAARITFADEYASYNTTQPNASGDGKDAKEGEDTTESIVTPESIETTETTETVETTEPAVDGNAGLAEDELP